MVLLMKAWRTRTGDGKGRVIKHYCRCVKRIGEGNEQGLVEFRRGVSEGEKGGSATVKCQEVDVTEQCCGFSVP